MTYRPPERNAHPGTPQLEHLGAPQSGPGDSGYPQHLWPDYAQTQHQLGAPAWSRDVPAAERPAGSGVLGVLALLLGLAAVVAPFLPMDMTGYRQYAAFPFALPGLGLAIAGLIGNRRGKAAATFGAIFTVLALCVGGYMVVTFTLR